MFVNIENPGYHIGCTEPRYNAQSEFHPELGWTYQKWLCGQLYSAIRIPRYLHSQKNTSLMSAKEFKSYCTRFGGVKPADMPRCRPCRAALASIGLHECEEFFLLFVLFHEATAKLVYIDSAKAFAMNIHRMPKANILTTQLVQSWFLLSTWQEIAKVGHDVLLKQAAETQIHHLDTKPGWSVKRDWSAIQLISQGKVYATLKKVDPGHDRITDRNNSKQPEQRDTVGHQSCRLSKQGAAWARSRLYVRSPGTLKLLRGAQTLADELCREALDTKYQNLCKF